MYIYQYNSIFFSTFLLKNLRNDRLQGPTNIRFVPKPNFTPNPNASQVWFILDYRSLLLHSAFFSVAFVVTHVIDISII